MRNRTAVFIKIGMLLIVGCALLTAESSWAQKKKINPNLRQRTNGAAVQQMTQKKWALDRSMRSAHYSAERLDEQLHRYLEISSMGRIERWKNNVSLEDMKRDYAKGTLLHLKSMTHVLQSRREKGGYFKSVREFDFRNLLNKSDYILSVTITKESMEYAARNGFSEELRTVLDAYNKERVLLDQKVVQL